MGTIGLCSNNLLISTLHSFKNIVPDSERSCVGRDNSTAIFLLNLPNAIDATLCPSISSLTLRNCATVVIIPAIKLAAPITRGAYCLASSGIEAWAKFAVPVMVLNKMTGKEHHIFCDVNFAKARSCR